MRVSNGLMSFALGVFVLGGTACAQNRSAVAVEAADAATVERADVGVVEDAGGQDARASGGQEAGATVRKFIAVEGANLKEKMEAATKRGRAEVAREGRFWTAYTFDVRPGVGVDVQFTDKHGTSFFSGLSFTIDSKYETRDVGIFVLRRASDGSIAEVTLYNLTRRREFGGYPVYWLGRAGNEESLTFLNELAASANTDKIAEHAAMAIAIHDDARVAPILKNLIRSSSNQKVRAHAALWLGHFSEELPFLTELARNNGENVEVRTHAILGIGASKDPSALQMLRGIYDSTSNRKVREHVFVAVSSGDEFDRDDAAAKLLIDIADHEKNYEDRKQAIFWLGQKAGQRSLKYLGDVVERSDGETEIQKQAVFALSQKPRDEAVPTLIRIARTHPKGEVRKQAIFWLGQIDDERALQFFKEILSK